MKNMILDDTKWHEAWLDTPLVMARRASSKAEAMTIPGAAVKSIERGGDGMPLHHAKIVTYGDEVVLRGYGDAVSPRFVWRGTQQDYYRLWECD